MFGLFSKSSKKRQRQEEEEGWLSINFSAENFIPGVIIGFLFGFFLDLTKLPRNPVNRRITSSSKQRQQKGGSGGGGVSSGNGEEFKMVLVVRQDLRMGAGKIASQCAHAATGIYSEMMQSQQSLLRQWELCGQPKIVVSCKNQQEMNKIKGTAEGIGLPTFVVADAGRTQVLAGSKTVLAVGPGRKSSVDSVTGKLRLL